MGSDSDQLENALLDVRKAYRLLFLYQRRILDLALTFANEMNLRPYCVGYGFNRPATVNPFDKWVWDMLPMYRISFLFLSSSSDQDYPKRGEWLLDLHLVSDSGYPEGSSWRKGEPDPETFSPAKNCVSLLGIYAFKSERDERRDWYNNIWRPAINYPFKYPPDWSVVTNGKAGVSIYGAQFNLLTLTSQEAMRLTAGQFKEGLVRDLQLSFP